MYISLYCPYFSNYKFYLRKNGQDYEISHTKDGYFSVNFTMPEKNNFSPVGGKDFQFVMKHQGKEYTFPFLNQSKEPIEVVIAETPVIKSISKTVLSKGDKLVVKGEHFLYNINYNKVWPIVLRFRNDYRGEMNLVEIEDYNHKTATFVLLDDYLSIGDFFDVTIVNDAGLESAPFAQKIYLKDSNIPPSRLKVTKAKIKDKKLMITFNDNQYNALIKAVVFPKLRIENVNHPFGLDGVISPVLSDNDYNYLANDLPKGYVIIQENGEEYQAAFSLIKGN